MIKDINEMPIVRSVIEYKEKKTVPLHMPGHKRGQSFLDTGMVFPWAEALLYDTTEVDQIDNLHMPEGAIREAEDKAAKLFGAEKTYFLVNGTTAGILAMIHSAASPGDSVIIPRNCHKSVLNAIVLGRLKPIYLKPELEGDFRVAMGIRPEAVEDAFEKNPEAKAVVITSPTYYGVCSDLEKIAEIAHRRGRLLLVDEAHGAHFCFSKSCPKSALDSGADAVAQSTHKCLSSFTGTSMLHIQGNRIDRERLSFYLQAYQTSSPNHLLLAGLDGARYQMEKPEGREKLGQVIEWALDAKKRINELPGLIALDERFLGIAATKGVDPTRLAVSVKGLGISGMKMEQILREEFNIQLEMADLYNIVAIFTIGDKKSSFDCFIESLRKISERKFSAVTQEERSAKNPEPFSWELPEAVLEPWEALFGQKKIVDIRDSAGEIAGELVIPYPPGIPVLMPGERISDSAVEYISNCIQNGIKVNSSAGNPTGSISVVTQ